MARDSLFGEQIVWEGRPRAVGPSPLLRSLAVGGFVVTVIAWLYASILWLSLGHGGGPPLLFGIWTAGLSIAALLLPRWWLRRVRFQVTEQHVIWQRGRFRRSIERGAISYARIFWDPRYPDLGDIELVRAVPTGALGRRLRLRLEGVTAPDRVWAIVRDVQTAEPAGRGGTPLTQRLDPGERVLWTATPRASWRDYLPRGRRELSLAVLGLLQLAVVGQMLWRFIPLTARLSEAGVDGASLAALIAAQTLAVGIVLTLATFLLHVTSVQPGRLVGRTRYLVTDRRVLIRRGREELHLDRSRIVDVIDTRQGRGLSDVFLVLDGPRARAVAASGAFGEHDDRGPELRPVLRSIEDVEGVMQALAQAA